MLDSIALRFITMNLNVVHDYNLPGVSIRLFEAGDQKFSNKPIKLILVVIALL
jgi:hypothetical protein